MRWQQRAHGAPQLWRATGHPARRGTGVLGALGPRRGCSRFDRTRRRAGVAGDADRRPAAAVPGGRGGAEPGVRVPAGCCCRAVGGLAGFRAHRLPPPLVAGAVGAPGPAGRGPEPLREQAAQRSPDREVGVSAPAAAPLPGPPAAGNVAPRRRWLLAGPDTGAAGPCRGRLVPGRRRRLRRVPGSGPGAGAPAVAGTPGGVPVAPGSPGGRAAIAAAVAAGAAGVRWARAGRRPA